MKIARSVVQQIRRDLPAGYVVADEPDHPHLGQPPDLLVGGEGRVLAVFTSPSSPAGGRALIARVTAARLALPPHSVFVLAIGRNSESAAKEVSHHFDFQVLENALDRELLALASATGVRPRREVPFESKRVAYIRYEILRTVSERRRRHVRGGLRPFEAIAPFEKYPRLEFTIPMIGGDVRARARQLPPPRVVGVGRALAAGIEGAPSRFSQRFRPLERSAFTESFVLDNGVPYAANVAANVVVVERAPTTHEDPEKPTRVAAFSGWIVTTAESNQDVARLIERTNEYLTRSLESGRA